MTDICVEVAVPTPLPRTFTYLAERPVPAGSRVLVPFGGRKLVGVSLGPCNRPEGGVSLKRILEVVDDQPVYSATVLEVARWISTYYVHPLGEVLRTMLPASATKDVKETYVLTERGKAEREAPVLKALFGKKKDSLSAAVMKAKLKRLSAEWTVKDLAEAGFITKQRATDVSTRVSGTSPKSASGEPVGAGSDADLDEVPDALPILTAKQQTVLDRILAEGLHAEKPARPFLLHGVTGSGKTEIYLRLISAALARWPDDAQALVLVPEISLTPQMTRVFERRFPGLVAVVHSAMTDTDRWARLDRIRRGAARILIGPRSAVFGPFKCLRLLVVDEEHDHSYKQTTGLPYNGRDIAVLRGRLEGATVVLGSATPSMETFQNALSGRYAHLVMDERATGRPLPEVELIEMRRPPSQNGRIIGIGTDDDAEIPLAPRVLEALRKNLAKGHQAIVLVNRRGYAYFLLNMQDQRPVQCPHCSISMTLHARGSLLRCHYCDYQLKVEKLLRQHQGESFAAVGYGSQKAEDCLKKHLPEARIVRLDSDTVQRREVLPETLGAFREGRIDILVGTQILAKGHDFPNVTLIVILEVDQLLGLPDFRAGERTFQLIVQAAGRAGRAELPGRVLIQTLRASHPVVSTAITQNYLAFAESELHFRKLQGYPPFCRMIAVELNSPDKPKLGELCRRIEGWIEQMAHLKPDLVKKVRVLGPSVPPIETIRGRHRRTLIFASESVEALRGLAVPFASTFQKLPADVRMKIDVDPQSLV